MRNHITLMILFISFMSFAGCVKSVVAVDFDGDKEVSGKKFSLKDINPDLPENWDEYNYVSLEYRINTSQRFQVGFTTDNGYNELRVMSYVPNAWNTIAIPLKFFVYPPDPASDLAATNNQPRYTGWINLGGKRGPLHGVDSIGFRMRRAIGSARLELRNVTLSKDDPGDKYMEKTPAVDRYGQSMLVDYPQKVSAIDDLRKCWDDENGEICSGNPFNYSRFGGYKDKNVGGTGYFRVEKIDGRWWFVDPEGFLFLSVGVDCVDIFPGGGIRAYDKRPWMFEELPPSGLSAEMNRGDVMPTFGMWNVYRRYGDNYEASALDMVIRRMEKWGLNTVANWSSDIVKDSGRKAFIHQLRDMGFQSDLMGLCDIYDPDYEKNLDSSIKRQVSKYHGNPWLIGYFIGNEPAWLNQEERLCDLILAGKERPVKVALQSYLESNGNSPESKRDFVYRTFRRFLEISSDIMRKYDPEHLNLGIRFGDPLTLPDEVLKLCDVFDVFSFNCYDLLPRNEVMDKVKNLIDLPMIIGEYHFGTVDRGYAQSLWQVESQEQRGVAYRYYTEHAYSHPSLIGTGYFQWADQDISGRFDGENYNCGLIDVTDRPYKEQTDAMTETSKLLYGIHSGKLKPYDVCPVNCRGHELIPDLW